jgi:lysophospholipid acyltransferase (LPLAT)-like uncharacterized protein
MNSPSGKSQDSPHHQSFGLKTFLSPLGILYRLWTLSIRLSYKDEDGRAEIRNLSEPATIILWHNRLFLAGEWHQRFRKKRKCYGLISGSRDGAWLETFYGWAGIRAIRGSRNRRGSQATRELIRLVNGGNDAGITPDGSRGPKYQAKSGALLIARASRSPVVLLSFSYGWAIRLKSWDQFVIPLPFSKINARTKLLPHEELFRDRDLEEATKRVEHLLASMTHD